MYNESLPMKFTNTLIKKKKKIHTAVNEKEKLGKFVLCSITDCLIKPFKTTINQIFLLGKLIRAIFAFRNQDDARNIIKGKLGIANS